MPDRDERPLTGPTPRSTAEALRLRAVEIAAARDAEIPAAAEPLSAEEAREVIHELQVHQIELELQNDELRRAQESLEAARAAGTVTATDVVVALPPTFAPTTVKVAGG